MDAPDRQQNEFNMALSYIGRLNVILIYCAESSINLDVNTWLHSLNALYRELSTEMHPEERHAIRANLDRINTLLSQNRGLTRQGQISPEIYALLTNTEIELRIILKKAGLLTKVADDASKALR